MNIKTTPLCSYKLAPTKAVGEFDGYASTFDSAPDSYGDVIAPGAFKRSLAAHAARGTSPAMLWVHQVVEPVGAWRSLQEDGKGLRVGGKLTLETQRGKEAHALTRDGALSLSIGYTIPKGGETVRADGTRLLSDIDLVEISLVPIPANPEARITSVKSALAACRSARDFEDLVRAHFGLSNSQAKRLTAGGWPALARIDDAGDDKPRLAKAYARITELNNQLKGN